MKDLNLVKTGTLFFAVTTIGYGILNFVYWDFIMGRTPVRLSEVSGQFVWAYFLGALLIICEAAMATGKRPGLAAILVAVMIFTWFLILHIPRAVPALGNRHRMDPGCRFLINRRNRLRACKVRPSY